MSKRESGRIEIAKTQQAVWKQLTTVADIPTWYDNWDSCQHDPNDTCLREGQQFQLHSRRGRQGRRARSADCHVVTVEESVLIRWIEHHRREPPVLVEFHLQAASSERTVVTLSKTIGTLRRIPASRE